MASAAPAPRLLLALVGAGLFTAGLLTGHTLTLWRAEQLERHAAQSRRRAAAWRSVLRSAQLVCGGAALAMVAVSAARYARRSAAAPLVLVDAVLPAAVVAA